MRILGELRTTSLRVLLNTYEGATAAIEFVLRTNLLAQFSLVARKEQAERLRDAEESGRRHCRSINGPSTQSTIENEIELDPS
jgi:hypothetical protein